MSETDNLVRPFRISHHFLPKLVPEGSCAWRVESNETLRFVQKKRISSSSGFEGELIQEGEGFQVHRFARGGFLFDDSEIWLRVAVGMGNPELVKPPGELEFVLCPLQRRISHPLNQGEELRDLTSYMLGKDLPGHSVNHCSVKALVSFAEKFQREPAVVAERFIACVRHFLKKAAEHTVCVRPCEAQGLQL